jgi:hypothetical protein
MYYVRLSHLSRLKHKHRENLDQWGCWWLGLLIVQCIILY